MTLLLLWLLLINTIRFSDQKCSMIKILSDKLKFHCAHTSSEEFLDDFYSAIQDEQLPEGNSIFYELEIIDSNFTNIHSFNSPLPHRKSYLYSLKIANSSVERIDEDAFRTLINLEVLSLSNNKLTNLDFLKLVPVRFQKLYLNGNYFKMDTMTFPEEGYVPYLDISDSNISTIYGKMLVREVNMSRNKIQSINNVLAILSDDTRYLNLAFNDFKNASALRPSKRIRLYDLILAHSNIRVIDPQIFTNLSVINSIDFSGNNIRYLQSYTFKNCHFRSLNLYNSSINDMEANTFNGMYVDFLNISHNNISILRDYLFNGISATELDLSNSGLKQIQSNAFHGMIRLERLILAKNQIKFLENNTFEGLTSLNEIDLSFNSIEKIDAFKIYGYYNKIDLSNNLISKLTQHSFKNLKHIEKLYLGNNRISELLPYIFEDLSITKLSLKNNNLLLLKNNVFSKMQTLKHLDLSSANLSKLEPDSFAGLNELQELNLKDNNFYDIPSTAFVDLKQLKSLDLTGNDVLLQQSPLNQNNLKELNVTFEQISSKNLVMKLTELETLNIFDSNISLKFGDFKDFINLKTLNFYNVTVQKIKPGSFIGLNSLININEQVLLKKLTVLKSYLFRGLWHLYSLNLSNLQVTKIEPNCFKGLPNLKIALLNGNKILKLVDRSFDGLRTLQVLNLSRNIIGDMEIESFQGLEMLSDLSLAINNISSISVGTFQVLPHLKTLNLQRNHIKKLTSGVFSNLKNLIKLDLSYNSISVFEEQIFFSLKQLNYLDFSNNNLISVNYVYLLKSLPSLSSININYNKWKCKNLDFVLNMFYNKGINWITNQPVYDVENVGGILCIDDCKFLHCVY